MYVVEFDIGKADEEGLKLALIEDAINSVTHIEDFVVDVAEVDNFVLVDLSNEELGS